MQDFLQDNAPRTARMMTKEKILELKWSVLSDPPCFDRLTPFPFQESWLCRRQFLQV